MKDIQQVLRQKEMELARVRLEVDELRGIIPWLAEDPTKATSEFSPISGRENKWFLEPDEKAA